MIDYIGRNNIDIIFAESDEYTIVSDVICVWCGGLQRYNSFLIYSGCGRDGNVN